MSVFVLYYYILFHYYLIESVSFLMRDKKGMDPDGRKNGKELEGAGEGKETVARL